MTKQFNEENIRVAAYFLWENAGRPNGMEKEFWHQACNQLFGLNNSKNCCNKKASKDSFKKPVAKKSSAKASINKISVKPAVVAKPFYGTKK